MLSILLNALQLFLVPLVIGLVLVAAVIVLLLGRQRRGPAKAPDPSTLIKSTLEDDSDFAARLKTAAPSAPPAAVPLRQPSLPLAADLLLVDDSAVARAKLRKLFEPKGYRVHLARDGVEALALLDKGRYGLMITDLEMPNMDGVSLIGTVQRQAHAVNMPIVAITGHEDLQARLDECQQICGIYSKPWVDEDLSSHVAALVTTRSATTSDAQRDPPTSILTPN
jgi:chemosensory pili system protein ChpA (sensor histidine kinase/response regulator)